MSKSNASAKNRRAFIDTTKIQNQPSINNIPQPSQNTGLTIQQVISILDKRLIAVETFMKEEKESKSESSNEEQNFSNNLEEIISEFNSRFDILAEEVGNLKEIILKLQTYTMDVNKMLLERNQPSMLILEENTILDSTTPENEVNVLEISENNEIESNNNVSGQSSRRGKR